MGKSWTQAIEVNECYEGKYNIIATMMDDRVRWFQNMEQLSLQDLDSICDLISDLKAALKQPDKD